VILPRKASGLSFVTPVAYDFRYALAAIQAYYGVADEIVLGLDKDRISWNGRRYDFDDAGFQAGLKAADPQGKVKLVEADFHSRPTPGDNDTGERSDLSLHCDPANWIVQIDSDELVMNGPEFRAWLLQRWSGWNVLGRWTTVFKVFGADYLVIDKPDAWVSIATRLRGGYSGCRNTPELTRKSPLRLYHFSWGRTDAELYQKLKSWTHANDFDVESFFAFWQGVTLENYATVKDFHPMDGPDWPALRLVRQGDPGWVAPPA
jgi:hypothetical protein